MMMSRSWRAVATALLMAGLLSGCSPYAVKIDSADARRQMREALAVPDGLAMVAVYSTRATPNRGLNAEILRGPPWPIAEHFIQFGQMRPDVIYLPPGRYTLRVSTRTEMRDIGLDLAAGEIAVFRHTGNEAPFVERVAPETLLNESALRGYPPTLSNSHVGERALERAIFLHADSVEGIHEDRCYKGVVDARWSNARFRGRFDDCVPVEGRFEFDDGTRIDAPFARLGGVGILVNTTFFGNFIIFKHVLPDLPAAKAGISTADALYAVDNVVINSRESALAAVIALRGAPDSTVKLSLGAPFAGKVSRTLELKREAFPGLFDFQPAAPAVVNYPDGRRFRGHVRLEGVPADGKQQSAASLKPPRLEGLGQLTHPGGTGYLGHFENDLPNGDGYCFGPADSGPCHYRHGVRMNDNGTASRTRAEVLARTGPIPGASAVDLLRQQWIQALMEERWGDFLERLADLHALGFDTGGESLFFESRALQALGQPDAAIERLSAYLTLMGSTGASYAEAIALYQTLQAPAASARETRLARVQAARAERLAYCEIEAGTERPACGCREFAAEIPRIARSACDNGS